jgi:hypothetical protein
MKTLAALPFRGVLSARQAETPIISILSATAPLKNAGRLQDRFLIAGRDTIPGTESSHVQMTMKFPVTLVASPNERINEAAAAVIKWFAS